MIRTLPKLGLAWIALGWIVIATPSAIAGSSPDEKLCDGFIGASAKEKASRLADFYLAIVTNPTSKPHSFLDCIARKIEKLDSLAEAYCSIRAERGHGILAREVDEISFEFRTIYWDCERAEQEPFFDRIKSPIYCRDIESVLRDSLPLLATIRPPSQVECMRHAIPEVAAGLRSSCDREPIPGPVAARYLDILAAACPASNAEP